MSRMRAQIFDGQINHLEVIVTNKPTSPFKDTDTIDSPFCWNCGARILYDSEDWILLFEKNPKGKEIKCECGEVTTL